MNDRTAQPLIATPDGEAELAVVLRLSWEDVAALGQEAGRLAERMQRPVTLDEAVSHRLRGRQAGSHARAAAMPAAASAVQAGGAPAVGGAAVSGVSSLPRTPGEQARQAIEKINGNGNGVGGAAAQGA
ncbi:hypothetical protein ACFFS2_28455 [Streptomyces aurantiacus]|uniref:Uncharacterized protein n=1 Tax=Streptomyces aurantiacus TaxID=47760 RepID=A0A7G1P1L4_9ACTN|nr:hypothetical protein [Streptomyces aurantiacus]BCL26955.1 hypothetical protein GCM10017557_18140 [Streptomyces aurantiacus]